MPLHLTCDDGPSPTRTPVVLAARGRIGAPATCPVLGRAVRRRTPPAAVRHGRAPLEGLA